MPPVPERVPTRHRVRLSTGVEVHAMCVIDALGTPAMLDADAVITTTDPTSDRPITVTVADGRSTWHPASAVVFVGAQAPSGPSADICCDHLNAFTDQAAAESWTREHPHVTGEIIDHAGAELLGRQIFGRLLT
ncbi:MAG: alkylmercury lyase family protein [Pseudonocardiaceae bacterium]|nr:alkylmercury lyase family protein [Pseudonocardiaceae bacterium]